jgi:tRNA(His) guanylyltransferase
MAKSRFEYVRTFELPDPLLNNTFVVCRVDGRTFHKCVPAFRADSSLRWRIVDRCRFSDVHEFEKPNDKPALDLMDRAARAVMDELPDVVMAFGESDEYRWARVRLERRRSSLTDNSSASWSDDSQIFSIGDGGEPSPQASSLVDADHHSKINSTVVSIFTSAYVFYWPQYMTNTPMQYPPSFDGRVVLYPTEKEVRDYFSWRQADSAWLLLLVIAISQLTCAAHINNLYNTAYHALLKGGQTPVEANQTLQASTAPFW